MVKSVRVYEVGGPEVLRLEEAELPEPGPGELRIRFKAAGLNRAESNIRKGTYVYPTPLPTRLGFEGAGHVTAVGADVTDFAVGDYVSFIPGHVDARYGCYAEEAVMPARLAMKTPADIEPETAAAMWMPFLTAYGGLVEAGGLRAGERVLLTAAASSVGLAAIQICRKYGAVPIATTRTADKRNALLKAGAASVIVTTDTDLVGEVMAATGGQGADLVFDPVAGPGTDALGAAAAFNGRIILYGGLMGPGPYPLGPGTVKGLTMRAFYLLELTGKPEWMKRGVAFTLAGVADGSLRPAIDRTFPLAEVQAAHAYLDSNEAVGKIVLTCG